MPLTDTAIRNLKRPDRVRKVADERGLYLELTPQGGRWWRLKYRFARKEKKLSLGVYPEVSLKLARDKRDEARRLIAQGIDPGVERKKAKLAALQKSANSLESVAREWFGKKEPTWSLTHAESNRQRLEDYIYPQLGPRPIADISAPELLAVIRKVEARSLEVAHRTLRLCSQVFRYGIATGCCERDPAADLRGALPPFKNGHFAATLEPRRLGQILLHMDLYSGTPTVRAALRLAPLLFVRPGELRRAEWASINFETAEWRYTVTKTKTDHIVPLPRQAVAALRELQPLTGEGDCVKYVFPSARGRFRPMSENAVLVAMRSLQIGREEMTGHGLRAVARTLLDEELHFKVELIEHQLSHTVRDPLGRAYNRTQHLPERHRMMQAWADHLDALKRRSEMGLLSKRA